MVVFWILFGVSVRGFVWGCVKGYLVDFGRRFVLCVFGRVDFAGLLRNAVQALGGYGM